MGSGGRARLGEGLSIIRKLKFGESALERDSGVPTELRDPGRGLEVVRRPHRSPVRKRFAVGLRW